MNKVYLGVLTVLASAFICFGQTSKGQKTAPLADDGKPGKSIVLTSGTAINAELQKTLDVNNAKVGDQVMLKTTQTIRQDGQVIVPRGSTLVGRITDVQKRSKDNARSRIGMIFERIQGRQLSVPLSATLVSITNAAARASVNDTLMTDVSGSSQTSGSTRSTSSGGGLLGGVTNTVGSVVNTTTQTVGTVTSTAGQTVGSTTDTLGRTLGGIQISTEASGSANSSTTLSSTNKNLRVEKGATFHLRVVN